MTKYNLFKFQIPREQCKRCVEWNELDDNSLPHCCIDFGCGVERDYLLGKIDNCSSFSENQLKLFVN